MCAWGLGSSFLFPLSSFLFPLTGSLPKIVIPPARRRRERSGPIFSSPRPPVTCHPERSGPTFSSRRIFGASGRAVEGSWHHSCRSPARCSSFSSLFSHLCVLCVLSFVNGACPDPVGVLPSLFLPLLLLSLRSSTVNCQLSTVNSSPSPYRHNRATIPSGSVVSSWELPAGPKPFRLFRWR